MNVIILEDEIANANLLKSLINQYDNSIVILDVFKSMKDCRSWLSKNPQPDLVFSDIELLDGNVFKLFTEQPFSCPVIFTTAYDSFYQAAFETNGIAYLLKPIDITKLSQAIIKYRNLQHILQPGLKVLIDTVNKKLSANNTARFKERLIIKRKDGIRILPVNEVACFIATDGIVEAIDLKGIENRLSESINSLEESLNPQTFFKINRGELININFIEKIEPYFNDRLSIRIRNLKKTLIVSASRTHEFRKWIDG